MLRKKRKWQTVVVVAGCICVLLFLMGCQTFPKEVKIAPVEFKPKKYTESEVKLNPGDILDIRFFYTPELNTVQTIRPDGKIALQLVGEVLAQGKTPLELKEQLHEQYKQHIKQLDITVIVQTFSNRRVYVGGQVLTPGSVPMPGKLTALEAIMLAGGINLQNGSYENVLIIRFEDNKWAGGMLNLKKVLEGEKVEQFCLEPQDIVYVPETRIVEVNRWIDQNIDRILPEIGLTYTIVPGGPNTLGITTAVNPAAPEQN
ncbi:MAG: polysaccharide biosynthesis/export family protein [Spirochaetes bacterium]|nr:polysaccharide biosynthesis/export family protein [Spirochaetota bacterium]